MTSPTSTLDRPTCTIIAAPSRTARSRLRIWPWPSRTACASSTGDGTSFVNARTLRNALASRSLHREK
eukprot:scaffold9610_cov110-Isochrysis_galbana.AAC.3